MKDIGYVLADYEDVFDRWTCGMLMKYENKQESYVKHVNELKGHVGLLKIKTFDKIESSSNLADQNKYSHVIHLDENEVQYLAKNHQLNNKRI